MFPSTPGVNLILFPILFTINRLKFKVELLNHSERRRLFEVVQIQDRVFGQDPTTWIFTNIHISNEQNYYNNLYWKTRTFFCLMPKRETSFFFIHFSPEARATSVEEISHHHTPALPALGSCCDLAKVQHILHHKWKGYTTVNREAFCCPGYMQINRT